MAAGTRRTYVRSVADFSAFHGRSPDELTLEDVRDYQLHLVARPPPASPPWPSSGLLVVLGCPWRRARPRSRAGTWRQRL
jgi:hypothetical protein